MRNMQAEVDGKSMRYNNGKAALSNIPPETLQSLYEYCHDEGIDIPVYGLQLLAEHYTLATLKYPNSDSGFPNWAKGQLFESFIIDSMMRHFYAHLNGEEIDSDFGSLHLTAVAWGFVALHHFLTFYNVYKQFDDRKWTGFYVTIGNIFEQTGIEAIHNCISTLRSSLETPNNLSLVALYGVVQTLQLLDSDEQLTFKLDAERVAKIMNTEYGEANVSAK